jgi:LacI family transcriptional regulator
MTSQWDIAKALKLNQSTVSRALKGDRKISEELRQRVRKTAKHLGYVENPFIKVLMNQVRSKKKSHEPATLALAVDLYDRKAWSQSIPMKQYFQGATRRAAELGYKLEPFFLREDRLDFQKLDGILYARGIRGIILAPPWQQNWTEQMHWERYACIGTGWNTAKQGFDLVANDYSCNMIMAQEKLSQMGYSRVGVIMNPRTVHDRSIRWLPGFLECQEYLPHKRRVPLFVRNHLEGEKMDPFVRWMRRWKPDILLTADFHIPQWLEALGMEIPRDIGVAALGILPDTHWSGIEEDHRALGARAVEQVAAKLERNACGLSSNPCVTLIHGKWIEGKTLRRQGPPVPPPIAWEYHPSP